MIAHTPGPWQYHLGRGANPRFHVQNTGGYQIASTTELVRHPQAFEENAAREANARLIAAAPELLEALAALLEVVERIGPPPIQQGTLCEEQDWTAAVRKSLTVLAKLA